MSTAEHTDPTAESTAPPQAPEAAHIEQHSAHTSPPATQATNTQGPTPIIVQQPAKKHSFAEEVVGYAKEIRGTLLRQPETKEMGEKILKGEATYNPKESSEP
ncbi:hypothetical protein FOMPIDRAFT_1053199 [Fomitopsis schrenkii]|uniref:Uncharacterized protein n=1 Tax=Fomitopsis schrenkii TaxID=2126942 RepID=S8FDK3_FOMSC|nr:hypothetical protein FOMPIDRAFT_1053199 [Fomitopsis schrenkii]